MNRYNVFHRIHKGVRALLFDTSLLLQRTDFSNDGEARDAVGRLRLVIALFERYQHWEEQYVLPAVNAYEPSIAVAFGQDHEGVYLSVKKLGSLLTDFNNSTLPLEKVALGPEIITRFENIILATIPYMRREQSLVNKILWQYYADSELQQIAWKMASETEASLVTLYNKWMIRGLNNSEIIRWFKEVRQTMDGEGDFYQLLKTAEGELHPICWN